MKKLLSFLILLFLITNTYLTAQTYADYPEPKHVLVVFNEDDEVSEMIMSNYVLSRNIPSDNVLGLTGLHFDGTVSYPSGDVEMDPYKEIYKSEYNKGAWECYAERIAGPIEDYLNTTYSGGELLRITIRYIVLCKGVPMKLLTYLDFAADLDPDPEVEWNPSYTTYLNVSIDALVCLLFEPVINLYGTSASQNNP